jgi:hypothetical protein
VLANAFDDASPSNWCQQPERKTVALADRLSISLVALETSQTANILRYQLLLVYVAYRLRA